MQTTTFFLHSNKEIIKVFNYFLRMIGKNRWML
jgi:hypothetical protein